MRSTANLAICEAAAADWLRIARLHARSWKSAYGRVLSADYLEHRVEAEREAAWKERIGGGLPNGFVVLLALEGEELVGFVSVRLDADAEWGSTIENLHVDPERKGRGTGRLLMAAAARWVLARRPESRLYLWVFEENRAACGFYQRMGGEAVELGPRSAPDGGMAPEFRFVWQRAQLAALAAGLEAGEANATAGTVRLREGA